VSEKRLWSTDLDHQGLLENLLAEQTVKVDAPCYGASLRAVVSWHSQKFEKLLSRSDNLSPNVTPYEFRASTGLQLLIPYRNCQVLTQAFIGINPSSKLHFKSN